MGFIKRNFRKNYFISAAGVLALTGNVLMWIGLVVHVITGNNQLEIRFIEIFPWLGFTALALMMIGFWRMIIKEMGCLHSTS